MESFEDLGLSLKLVQACEKLGWQSPLKFQLIAIPIILKDKDVIGLALARGSGEIGAFALPILQKILDAQEANDYFACVLSPTRERVLKIYGEIEALASEIGVKCAVLVEEGQTAKSRNKKPHIIVGTPRCVLDCLNKPKGFPLDTLKYLVLDEADKMLDQSLDKILGIIPRQRRTFLFSATMTEKVKNLQRSNLRNPVKIEGSTEYSIVDTLKPQYCFLNIGHKDCFLLHIINEMVGHTAMVFTRTGDTTWLLGLMLKFIGFEVIFIHGYMSKDHRSRALNKFNNKGGCIIFVSTYRAIRELEIPLVDMVINYDIPKNSKDYLRVVQKTPSISLVHSYELELFSWIEEEIMVEEHSKHLPVYKAELDRVLLYENVMGEAKRIAERKMKEAEEKCKSDNYPRKGEDEDLEEYYRCKGLRKKERERGDESGSDDSE